jgi:hypothetical protein
MPPKTRSASSRAAKAAPAKKPRSANFIESEDQLLCQSYKYVSTDPTIGESLSGHDLAVFHQLLNSNNKIADLLMKNAKYRTMAAIRENYKFFTQLGMPSDAVAPLLEELNELTAKTKNDEGVPETVEVDDDDDDDDNDGDALDILHQHVLNVNKKIAEALSVSARCRRMDSLRENIKFFTELGMSAKVIPLMDELKKLTFGMTVPGIITTSSSPTVESDLTE